MSSGDYKTGVLPLGQKADIKNAIKNMSEDLPPMRDIETMFDHLVSRVPDVTKLVSQLNGRKLRVATMCSYVAVSASRSQAEKKRYRVTTARSEFNSKSDQSAAWPDAGV
jgi:hypothetical protein